jgi:hypothetical protein
MSLGLKIVKTLLLDGGALGSVERFEAFDAAELL